MTTLTPTGAQARASTLWIMLLTLASTATTLVLACATPFPALAALAATQMRARDGLWLMAATWAASQLVGFCLLDYPRDLSTFGWAAALGVAALVSAVAGRAAAGRIAGASALARIALAFLAATLAFKAVILLASFALGGVDIALSPAIFARQLVRNGAILAVLWLGYHALVRVGLPAARPATSAARC